MKNPIPETRTQAINELNSFEQDPVLIAKFNQFSPKRQQLYPEFQDAHPAIQAQILEKMVQDLNQQYYRKLIGPKIRHCSSETKSFCWNWFINEQNIAQKEEAYEQYEFRIAFEERLSYIFESFSQDLQQKYQHFYECRFEQKEVILQQLSEETIKRQNELNAQQEQQKQHLQKVNNLLLREKLSYSQYLKLEQTIKENLALTEREVDTMLEEAQQEFQTELAENQEKTAIKILQVEANEFRSPALEKLIDLQLTLLQLINKFPQTSQTATLKLTPTNTPSAAKEPATKPSPITSPIVGETKAENPNKEKANEATIAKPETKITAAKIENPAYPINPANDTKPEQTPHTLSLRLNLNSATSLADNSEKLRKTSDQNEAPLLKKINLSLQNQESEKLEIDQIQKALDSKRRLLQEQKKRHLFQSLKRAKIDPNQTAIAKLIEKQIAKAA